MKKTKELVKTTTQNKNIKICKKVIKNGCIITLFIISGLFGMKHYTESQVNDVSSSRMMVAKETLKGINPFREKVNIEDLKFIYESFNNYHYSDMDYLNDKREYFLFRNVLLKKYRDFLSYANLKDNDSDEEIINDLKFNFFAIVNYMRFSSMNSFHNKEQDMENLSYLLDSLITYFNYYYENKHNVKFENYNYDQRNFNQKGEKREKKRLGDIYYELYVSTLHQNINEANLVLKENPELMSYMISDYGDSYEQIKNMSISSANEIEKGMKKNRDLDFELNDSEFRYLLKRISYIKDKSKVIGQQIDREKFKNFNYQLWIDVLPIIDFFPNNEYDGYASDINKTHELFIKIILNDFNPRL